jgi:hypothetical protein
MATATVPIIFFHPAVKPSTLIINTGANQFSWSYNLHTQAYPTYAGEVVQILGCYIDNIVVAGEVESYTKMEEIYSWFIQYISIATQGFGGKHFNEQPVTMRYPERGWEMKIKPIRVPGLRYGRDVVVPTWQVEAAVVDTDPRLKELTLRAAQIDPDLTSLQADLGYKLVNPFSDPLAGEITGAEQKIKGAKGATEKNKDSAKDSGDDPLSDINVKTDLDGKNIVDAFGQVLENFRNGDFTTSVMEAMLGGKDASKPATNSDPKKNNDGSGGTNKKEVGRSVGSVLGNANL